MENPTKSSPGDDREAGYNEKMLEFVENQVINVTERDGKLEDLESRADILLDQTTKFKISKKTRKSNKKTGKRVCIIV